MVTAAIMIIPYGFLEFTYKHDWRDHLVTVKNIIRNTRSVNNREIL